MEIKAPSVTELYEETLWYAQVASHAIEETRNGKAKVLNEPLLICNTNPRSRVLIHPRRNPNPFFHLMECIWMFAGQNNEWITKFNKNMESYMDYGVFHGAYGQRWNNHWGFDQIAQVIRDLQATPSSRREYVSLWNPSCDLGQAYKDLPCNVGIAFQVRSGALNGYVFNRSNDLIWGMLGTNCVHFSMLLEVVASCTGLDLGSLYQFSINPHIYERHWPLLQVPPSSIPNVVCDYKLYVGDYDKWVKECQLFVDRDGQGSYEHSFLQNVAQPMCLAYLHKDWKELNRISAQDWKAAAHLWWEQNRKEAV